MHASLPISLVPDVYIYREVKLEDNVRLIFPSPRSAILMLVASGFTECFTRVSGASKGLITVDREVKPSASST